MSSLIQRYEYDIFISYRHNDNRSGWVTEFVAALQQELAATIKEQVSVYFDTNPHDGLLETHDVDGSLKEKIKCLVFIPIVSQTYCDPKSFAWQNEFLPFLDFSKSDEYGLDVRLSNGNVTKRVLPVRIHEIEPSDKKLFENEVGGVMRPVDFIYKTPGVNRPLRITDDSRTDNVYKTYYNDQVNKVANAIKDVLNSLNGRAADGGYAMAPAPVDRAAHKKTRTISSVSFFHKLRNITALNTNTWRVISLALATICIGIFWLGRETGPLPSDRAQITYDIPVTGSFSNMYPIALAVSHDAEFLVYKLNDELNLKSLKNGSPAAPIPGTKGADFPTFSPDGKWIGFQQRRGTKGSGSRIMKVPLAGSGPVSICTLDVNTTYGIHWNENKIIFSDGGSIYSVPDAGGIPELLFPLDKSEKYGLITDPQILPDQSTLLFSLKKLVDMPPDIRIWKIGSEENPAVLIKGGTSGRFLSSGHVVFARDQRLYISKFDAETKRIVAEPQLITTRPILSLGATQFDFSANGILVCIEETDLRQRNLSWIDQSGAKTQITNNPKDYYSPALSPDGQRIAVDTGPSAKGQIEIINPETGTSVVFADSAYQPVWSADNRSLIYVGRAGGRFNQILEAPIDRSKTPNLLYEIKLEGGQHIDLGNMSSDGRYLVLSVGGDIGYYDVMHKAYKKLEFVNTLGNQSFPAIVPDGKWLAYLSDESGKDEVYVAPFPGPGLPYKIDKGKNSVWSRDMKALYYNREGYMWKVRVNTKAKFSAEKPEPLFSGPHYHYYDGSLEFGKFDVLADGSRFLLLDRTAVQDAVKVIVNWEQGLK